MPRRPTGKRVPRDDGSFFVVNKAANRAGSVFHVPERRSTLPDGRVRVKRAHWRATYRDPVSGRQRWVYAPTRDEVTRRREQAIADGANRSPRSKRFGGRRTTGAFADWWLTTYAPRLRSGSIEKYRQRLDRLGPLADVAIGEVTRRAGRRLADLAVDHATIERPPARAPRRWRTPAPRSVRCSPLRLTSS